MFPEHPYSVPSYLVSVFCYSTKIRWNTECNHHSQVQQLKAKMSKSARKSVDKHADENQFVACLSDELCTQGHTTNSLAEAYNASRPIDQARSTHITGLNTFFLSHFCITNRSTLPCTQPLAIQ